MADREFSFAEEVKEELAHLSPVSAHCRLAELAALVRCCGTVELAGGAPAGGHGRLALSISTDHAGVARKVILLLKALSGLHAELVVKRRRRLRKNLVYTVRLSPQPGLEPFLQSLTVLDKRGSLQRSLADGLLNRDCCKRAYLRGTFLGCGWISQPDKGNHVELTADDPEIADFLGQLLFDYGLAVRLASRKQSLVLYFKEGSQVAQFLSVLGAHQALLKFEDVRAFKEMRNRVNRQVNADTANAGKTADAAGRQVAAILRIGLERLRPGLRELAQLRLAHPDASLQELGEMLSPRIGKSGVNHRMREILGLDRGGVPE